MQSHTYHRPSESQSMYSMDAQEIQSNRARHGPMSGSVELEYGVPTKKRRGDFFCEICNQAFTEKRALNRHKKENKQHLAKVNSVPARKHRCGACSREFAREHDLRRHRAEVHQSKRRKNGISTIATIFRHRSEDGLDQDIGEASVFEGKDMDFVFHGNDAASSQSSYAMDTENENLPPEVTPSTPMSLSKRASVSIQTALRRRLSQCPTPEIRSSLAAQRHHSLAISMNEPDHSARPGLERAFSVPLHPIEDSEEELDNWINLTENAFFQHINDEYKQLHGFLNGASDRSPASSVAQCPVCRAPHKDIAGLLQCLANDFEHPLRPHICPDCDFGFISPTHLQLHLASVRRDSHCGFRFPHTCSGHHPRHHRGPHNGGLHERMEAWYLLTLFFKARQLASKLDARRPTEAAADRRWTLAALRSKYRNFSVVSTLNVRSPTMPVVEAGGKEGKHSNWHIPAALEETLGKVARRFRELTIPHSHGHHVNGAPWRKASLM